jgi:hypothetical protein
LAISAIIRFIEDRERRGRRGFRMKHCTIRLSLDIYILHFPLQFRIRPHRRKGEVRVLYHHKVRGSQCHKNMVKIDSAKDA